MSRLSLTRRFLLYLIPVALFGILALGTSAYLISKAHIVGNVNKEIKMLSDEAGSTLSAFFNQRLNDLETMAESPLLADYYNNRDFGLDQEAESYRQEIERYFTNFSRRSGSIYNRIRYVGPDGAEVCDVENSRRVPPRGRVSRELLGILRGLKPGQHFRSSVESDPQYGPMVSFARPLFNPAGEFKGAVIAECSLKPVQGILDRLNIGPSGWAFVTDESNRFLVGKQPGQPLNSPDLLTSRSSISGTDWQVWLGADRKDFQGPLIKIQQLTLSLGILCGLLVVIFIYLTVRTLTQPIQRLVETTQKLQAGDLSGRVTVSGQDEIGTLSQAFNTMADSLQERTQDLEARVRQLTALRDMEGAVIQRMDEETILKNCLKAVAKGLSFDRTALYWVDSQRHEIRGRYLYGADETSFSENSFRERRIPLDGGDILCEVVRTRSAALVKDVGGDQRLNPAFIRETKTREFVLAPICGKDRVFGVLAVDNFYSLRPLKESDKDGLTLFAHAVGLALENATLFQHLTESEGRYRTVLESSPVAIMGLSREHRITTWNRGAELIFGYRSDEVIGKPLTALFPVSSAESFRSLLAEVMQKGSLRDYPIAGLTRNREVLDLSLSWGGAYPDFWMNKEWSVVIRDVTEGKKLQKQIIRSEKLSVVGQLISSIAHELNNPLQAVVGYAQLLSMDLGSGPDKSGEHKSSTEDLQMIVENALRCRKIIDNLLLFVRHGEVEKKAVRVEDAIRASLELLDYKLKKVDNIRVEVEIDPQIPKVKADLQQIQQVFVNLVNNACDAMTGWSGAKTLRIQAARNDRLVRVQVADSGPGIPEHVRERIFDPFFTTKSEGKGTGLGLSISRQIIEEHGGRIGFRSEPGQGTTFWLELPEDQTGEGASGAPRSHIPAVPGKSVLLVEDEAPVLSFLAKVVGAENDLVETAVSLKEAKNKAAARPFDLVVTDLQLGDGTGLELFERWSEWSPLPRPAFLFLTGDVLNAAWDRLIQSKGLAFLQKPVDLQSFQTALRRLLSGKSLKA